MSHQKSIHTEVMHSIEKIEAEMAKTKAGT